MLARATLQITLANLLVMVLGFIANIITARWLGPDGRGILAAMLLAQQALGVASISGLSTSVVYFTRKYSAASASLFLTNSLIILLMSSFLVAIASIFSVHLANFLKLEHATILLQFLLVAVPTYALGIYVLATVQSMQDFNVLNVLRVVQAATIVIGIIFLWQLNIEVVAHVSFAYVGAGIFVTVLGTVFVFRRISFRTASFPLTMGEQFRYAFAALLVDLSALVATQLDKALVIAFLSASDLGVYATVYAVSRLLTILPSAVATVFFSVFSGASPEFILERAVKSARVTTIVLLFAAAPFFLFGDFVLETLFGPRFAEGYVVLLLLTCEVVVGGVAWVLAQAFTALGKPRYVVSRQFAGIIATLGFGILLIPEFGIVGAGVASLAGAVTRLAVSVIFFVNTFGCPLMSFVPTSNDARFLVKNMISALNK